MSRALILHYLVISLNVTQLSLHIKPCVYTDEHFNRTESGCRWKRLPGRPRHGPLRFQMILECHCTLTGMPPFVVAMEEGQYTVSEEYALLMMMILLLCRALCM